MQFESVVTNSELSFKDIAFLELDPRIAALFKLSESGDIDWQTMFDDFGNISSNFTKENLQDDIDKLYNMGVDLVPPVVIICRRRYWVAAVSMTSFREKPKW